MIMVINCLLSRQYSVRTAVGCRCLAVTHVHRRTVAPIRSGGDTGTKKWDEQIIGRVDFGHNEQ